MKQFLILLVRAYQLLVRPALAGLHQVLAGPELGPRCRYYPSCSDYALEALQVHGGFRGLVLTLRRVLRCHPWAPGGVDPVPPVGKGDLILSRGAPAHPRSREVDLGGTGWLPSGKRPISPRSTGDHDLVRRHMARGA